jgi:archaellin
MVDKGLVSIQSDLGIVSGKVLQETDNEDDYYIPVTAAETLTGITNITRGVWLIGAQNDPNRPRYVHLKTLKESYYGLDYAFDEEGVLHLSYANDEATAERLTFTEFKASRDDSFWFKIENNTLTYNIETVESNRKHTVKILDTHGNVVFSKNQTKPTSCYISNLKDGDYTMVLFVQTSSGSSNYSTKTPEIQFTMKDGQSTFTYFANNYYNNQSKIENYQANPNIYFTTTLKEEAFRETLTNLSNDIVSQTDDDYAKAKKLFKYVANALYYNNDMLTGVTPRTAGTMNDILTTKEGVCTEYAYYYCELLKAQGIPSVIINCYAAPNRDDRVDSLTMTGNHVFVASYINDTVIISDPTYQSYNRIDNKVSSYKAITDYYYFDIGLDSLAYTYYIFGRTY